MVQQRTIRVVVALHQRYGVEPFTIADALAGGVTRAELRTAVAAGRVHRLHRGVLAVAGSADLPLLRVPTVAVDGVRGADQPRHEEMPTTAARPAEEALVVVGTAPWIAQVQRAHRAAVAVARTQVSDRAVVAQESAAIVHGIARPSLRPPSLADFIVPGQPDFVGDGLRVRGSRLLDWQQVVVDGLVVTTLARTAIDLARGRRLPDALIPLDSAMRLMLAAHTGATGNALRMAVLDPELRAWARAELSAVLRTMPAWPGTVAARTAVALADPAAESAAESRSRGWILESDLPVPEVGVPLAAASGRTYWADLRWRRQAVIGEVDGWGKYGSTADDVREALRTERGRQHELEDTGNRLVRWASTDERTVVPRISRALRSPVATSLTYGSF